MINSPKSDRLDEKYDKMLMIEQQFDQERLIIEDKDRDFVL